MYVPRHFDESRTEVLHELIRCHPLGALIAHTEQGLDASHVPFELDAQRGPHGTLRCHLAKANPLWKQIGAGAPVMVVFQGAHAYISPSWYASKQEHGKVVPTWNYVVVHAHGTATTTHDPVWLRTLVEDLTRRQETGRIDPWQVSDAPSDYVDKMLGAIVGVEIPIARLTGAWKLSQNRSPADRRGAIEGLRQESGAGHEVAELIGQRP
jgi:transcriptional regulator